MEAADAVENGADELDMVVNLGFVKSGQYDRCLEEIKEVKKACRGRILKVIIETCLLTEEEKKPCAGWLLSQEQISLKPLQVFPLEAPPLRM